MLGKEKQVPQLVLVRLECSLAIPILEGGSLKEKGSVLPDGKDVGLGKASGALATVIFGVGSARPCIRIFFSSSLLFSLNHCWRVFLFKRGSWMSVTDMALWLFKMVFLMV